MRLGNVSSKYLEKSPGMAMLLDVQKLAGGVAACSPSPHAVQQPQPPCHAAAEHDNPARPEKETQRVGVRFVNGWATLLRPRPPAVRRVGTSNVHLYGVHVRSITWCTEVRTPPPGCTIREFLVVPARAAFLLRSMNGPFELRTSNGVV
jgi:hypothetical protein